MKIHRRRFLSAASATALWARQPDPVPPYTIQRVAPGVWFALASPCAVFNCNAAIFEQARGLVVVDSNNMPSLAEALLAHLGRELPAKPVHTLVYSHHHFDHVQGTAAFRKRWPGLRIVSTEATKSLLLERGEQWIQSTVTNAEKIAASTSDPTARQQALTYAGEMKGARPVLPDTTFTSEFFLPDSIQPLELHFAGRGHTAGDLLVLSPTRKIVAAGDFAHESGLPFLLDSYPREWIPALRKWASLEFVRALGGHGPTFDKRAFTGRADYLEELLQHIQHAKSAGKTLDALVAELTPDKMKSLASDYGLRLAASIKLENPATQATPLLALAPALRSNIAQAWQRIDAQ